MAIEELELTKRVLASTKKELDALRCEMSEAIANFDRELNVARAGAQRWASRYHGLENIIRRALKADSLGAAKEILKEGASGSG